MSKERSRGPTVEQIATREQRLRDVEAARNSPIFGPYFPLVEANVLKNSTIVIPVRAARRRPTQRNDRAPSG
jgi:hypothetical protein